MSDGAFVLPSGVQLSIDDGHLSITHAGNVVVEGVPAQPIKNLISTGGDVVLATPDAVSIGAVQAAGTVRVKGKVQAVSISGGRVEFDSGTLKVEVLKADEAIALGGKKLEATVVVAPEVSISTSLKGRATAIQSGNELGAHKLKGGFSLREFIDLMPGGSDLLETHGIEVPEEEEEEEEEEEDDEAPAGAHDAEDDSGAEDAESEPVAVADEDDALDIPSGVPAVLKAEIEKTYRLIVDAYGKSEPPPPVQLVASMIEAGDFADLKLQINTIWADLIKFHAVNKSHRMPARLGPLFESMQLVLRRISS